MTHSDLRSLDLQTLNVVAEIIRSSVARCQAKWKEDSESAATEGKLIPALMFQNWSFASDLIGTTVSSELTTLMGKALDAQFPVVTPIREMVEAA
jgi:hypothetical protein